MVQTFALDSRLPIPAGMTEDDPKHPKNVMRNAMIVQNQAVADTKYDPYPPSRISKEESDRKEREAKAEKVRRSGVEQAIANAKANRSVAATAATSQSNAKNAKNAVAVKKGKEGFENQFYNTNNGLYAIMFGLTFLAVFFWKQGKGQGFLKGRARPLAIITLLAVLGIAVHTAVRNM